MFCCVTDPDLARLLAGKAEGMPDHRESRWLLGALVLETFCLLALGAVPW
ncbi:hypothetical protein [Rubellimicrobium rubrum]|nr:hypothetical protein [Rubellimicrobium rubrum]